MKNKKKRIIILVVLIIVLFICGMIVGGYLLKKDNETIKQNKQLKSEELLENDRIIAKEKFNDSFNSGKIVGENELIYGYVDSINGDIAKISDIYRLRGGRGFECKEYTEAYVDLENVEIIEYYGREDKIDKDELIGNIIFCKGRLVEKGINSYSEEVKEKFLKVNNNKIATIDRFYFYDELNQIINEKQKINNIEMVDIDTEEKEIAGDGGLDRIKDFDKWLEKVQKDISINTTDKDRIPATLYLTVRKSDKKIVGNLQIRHFLNEKLLNYGGHIGDSVRPSERKNII